ncbi:paraquat-inducible protein A, partial [Pseudomonas sp. UBA6310]|uniref:paraquat-inducible protein A n=1 Tax=Pseudomonas sp. UBA6310 TaxID=1947327 RepID=UPI0039C94BBD
GYELYTHRHSVVSRSLALVLAALLLYFPANLLPIMRLDLRSRDLIKAAGVAREVVRFASVP